MHYDSFCVFFQRLLQHTEEDHEDVSLLRTADKEIHELALKFDSIQKETIENEQRQKVRDAFYSIRMFNARNFGALLVFLHYLLLRLSTLIIYCQSTTN